MWEAYFLDPRPELSAASGYTSRLKPDAPTPAVQGQMDLTTDVNPILTSEQQPGQPIEPRRSARLHQKRLAKTAPAEQPATGRTSVETAASKVKRELLYNT